MLQNLGITKKMQAQLENQIYTGNKIHESGVLYSVYVSCIIFCSYSELIEQTGQKNEMNIASFSSGGSTEF